MRDIEEIMNDLDHLSILCRVLACSLDECEFSAFSLEEVGACLHHFSCSLNRLLNELSENLNTVHDH